MDNKLESKIIKAFFYPNKQDRILFELLKNMHREVIHRLCHSYNDYIDRNYVVAGSESKKGRSSDDIIKVMQDNGVSSLCYVISEYEEFNRKQCKLKEALDSLNSCNGFAFLIVGLPSGFTFFQGESHSSYQPNFFLKPKMRFDGIPWGK